MKDNIDNKFIGNRKIIIELRFDAIPSIIDKKGTLIEAIEKANPNLCQYWEMNNEGIIIRDTGNADEYTCLVALSYKRLSFTSWHIDSVESFYASFKKIYDAVLPILGQINLTRIGCRIISSYKVKAKDYQELLDKLKSKFPTTFFFDKYPTRNLSFKMRYDNGMYVFGLITENDDFFNKEFSNSNPNRHFGFIIDTDNFVTNEVKAISDKELIKNIYMLSLSVEKDIHSNLSDL